MFDHEHAVMELLGSIVFTEKYDENSAFSSQTTSRTLGSVAGLVLLVAFIQNLQHIWKERLIKRV